MREHVPRRVKGRVVPVRERSADPVVVLDEQDAVSSRASAPNPSCPDPGRAPPPRRGGTRRSPWTLRSRYPPGRVTRRSSASQRSWACSSMCVKTLLENTRSKWASGNGNGGYRPFRSKRAYGKLRRCPLERVGVDVGSAQLALRREALQPHHDAAAPASEVQDAGRTSRAGAPTTRAPPRSRPRSMRPDSRNVASPSRTPDDAVLQLVGRKGLPRHPPDRCSTSSRFRVRCVRRSVRAGYVTRCSDGRR